MSENLSYEKAIDIAACRAQEWFKVHAEQRLQLFNFYVVLIAAAVAGFASALEARLYPFAIAISVVLLVLTYAFKSLDRRVAELVKIAERAHDKIDELVSERLQIEDVRLAKLSDRKGGTKSYRQAFNIIFLLGVLLALIGGGLAVSGMFFLPTSA